MSTTSDEGLPDRAHSQTDSARSSNDNELERVDKAEHDVESQHSTESIEDSDFVEKDAPSEDDAHLDHISEWDPSAWEPHRDDVSVYDALAFDPLAEDTSERNPWNRPPLDIPDGAIAQRARWQGTRHRARRYIAKERGLAESLDALEADDLSIHLYNVHVLKKREGTEHLHQAGNSKPWERKERWANAAKRFGDWVPREDWTAWPLEPERVPRPWERFSRPIDQQQDDPDMIRSLRYGREKPSLELEDILHGEILRQAREQFHASGLHKARSFKRSSPPRKRQKTEHPESASPSDHSQQGENSSPSTKSTHDVDDSKVRNVFYDDDEFSRGIVQPAVRHVLANFDQLLTTLHRSRQNHIERDTAETESDGSAHATSSDVNQSSSVASSSAPSSNTRRRVKSEQSWARTLRQLSPRDWSEVLGNAMICGWEETVVRRAAARCSDLFGEAMTFTKLDEGIAKMDKPNTIASHTATRGHGSDFEAMEEEDSSDLGSSADETYGGVHVDGFMKPIKWQAGWDSSIEKPESDNEHERAQPSGMLKEQIQENSHGDDFGEEPHSEQPRQESADGSDEHRSKAGESSESNIPDRM